MQQIDVNNSKIINGKAFADKILYEVKEEIKQNNFSPRLAALIIGKDQGSYTYQRLKEMKCAEVGIRYSLYAYPKPPTYEMIIKKIDELNKNTDITGIMIQLPVPSDYDENELLDLISFEKDVDGLNYINIGRSYYNSNAFIPCAAEGIIQLLKMYNIQVKAKKAVVLGRGRLLGTPVAQLLEKENAFVTKIHSIVEPMDLHREIKNADIIISATGNPGLIKASMLKSGVVAVDCANTVYEREFQDDVFDKVSFIATVPGGIGPMTIASLIKNTLKAYKQNNRDLQ